VYLVLLGPPGTGKGTQAQRVAERLGLVHIATGDMFREAVKDGTELGKQARAYMDRGDLVPDELTVAMLVDRIGQPDAQRGVLFDGFPRTLGQAKALDSALQDQGKEIDAAILVDASDDEIIRRLSGRWLCPNCGEIYHEVSRPPGAPGKCDACGAELRQRQDDRPDVVRTRLEKQRPDDALLAHYKGSGKLFAVDGEQAVDRVTADLLAAIDRLPSVERAS
jgi:adenylate kinase